MDDGYLKLDFYPFGSRCLSLSLPMTRGSDIWLIQRWLNRVSRFHSNWYLESVPEDGILNNRLLQNMRRLAKYLMLWQPWQICDVSYLIFGQVSGRFLSTGIAFGARPLMPGDEGHDVWVLQNRLVGANRRLALILGRVPDGVYDLRTARMVRVFQRESQALFPHLRVTGHVLPHTFLALWDRTILGGRELQMGDRGLDVLSLQELLLAMGYKVELNGIFDIQLKKALSAWQRERGLSVSGRFTAIESWLLGLERGY